MVVEQLHGTKEWLLYPPQLSPPGGINPVLVLDLWLNRTLPHLPRRSHPAPPAAFSDSRTPPRGPAPPCAAAKQDDESAKGLGMARRGENERFDE